ncbi:hypothetical protein FDP41_000374 [Naegleria fowleri]|uniref:Uncharacterized protein n=1 Tax=Naegleria fowleri TaxID=5763 RepID=A0A6A5CGS0_NAEFO|nr:uncharacterized protein FDP41_000374 [Naegleria fowleri]KAF0984475.1 hypothetical protein FDP41_000374 [Naegleria fowleri]
MIKTSEKTSVYALKSNNNNNSINKDSINALSTNSKANEVLHYTRNGVSSSEKKKVINVIHRIDSADSGSVLTNRTNSGGSRASSASSTSSSSSSRSSDHMSSTQKNGKSSEQSKSSKQAAEKQTPTKTIAKPYKSQSERINNNSLKQKLPQEVSSPKNKNESTLPKKDTKQEVVDTTQTLELRHQKLSSFPEAHLVKTELVKLDISFNSFSDLEMLSNFPKLVSFKAMYNKLKTLDGIELCEQIKDCNITGNAIEDVSKLAFCKKLETLSLDGNKIASFPSLSSLKCLTSLSVDNNCLKTFDGISGLENLTTFSAARNYFEKLTGLGKCRFRSSLLELDLSFNMLDKADFACLPTFDKLELLDQVLKREQTSLKEAEEVKALFLNLEKQTRKLEKTFENSLHRLDANLNEIKKGIIFELDIERKESESFVDLDPQNIDARSSQTLDLNDIRKSMNRIEKKPISKAEDVQIVNVRKSLNHIERIRAAQHYSKTAEVDNKETSNLNAEFIDDSRFVGGGHSVNDASEKVANEVEQFLHLLNSKTAERKGPPSSSGLKVRRKQKDS